MPEGEPAVAIVTGAASGIGRATVHELAGAGLEVAAVDRQAEPLEATVGDARTGAGRVSGRVADVSDAAAMRGVVGEVAEGRGRVDLVVACAGVNDQSAVATGDPERWREVVEANLLGVAYTARAAVPQMQTQGSGHIVVVASVSGRVTYVGEPMYLASKHGAVAFTESLRQEVAGEGIRVTLIEPGLVDTPMLEGNPFAAELMQRITPLAPADCARLIRVAFEQPSHVSLNEIVIRPTGQEL